MTNAIRRSKYRPTACKRIKWSLKKNGVIIKMDLCAVQQNCFIRNRLAFDGSIQCCSDCFVSSLHPFATFIITIAVAVTFCEHRAKMRDIIGGHSTHHVERSCPIIGFADMIFTNTLDPYNFKELCIWAESWNLGNWLRMYIFYII